MPLTISFNGTDKTLEAWLQAKGPNIVKSLVVKLNSLMIQLQARVVSTKLEGQVLHHRTGKLIDSIRVIPPTVEGGKLTAGVQGAGGPAWYGKLHETGGDFFVPEHTRRIGYDVKGHITHLLTRGGRVRSGVEVGEPGTVRAYTVHFLERSFMRTSQQEMKATIESELRDAAGEASK